MDDLYTIGSGDNGQTVSTGVNQNFSKVKQAIDTIESGTSEGESSYGRILDIVQKDNDTDIGYTYSYGYIRMSDGGLRTSSATVHSSPIRVSKGDVVSIKCCLYGDCAVISATDSNGTSYTPKVAGGGESHSISSNDEYTYEYTAENDGYICVSWIAADGRELKISRKVSLELERIDGDIKSINNTFGSPQVYLSAPTGDDDLSLKTIAELYAAYDALCLSHPQMIAKDENLGMDESNTYEIRQYTIAMNAPYQINGEYFGTSLPETNYWNNAYDIKKVVAVATGCHGNEKNVTWGVYLAIKELIESDEPWATYIKGNFIIKLLPCINPYGYENFSRTNSNGVDINRNIFTSTEAESVAWRKFFDDNKDNMVTYLDMHGTSGRFGYFECKGEDIYFDDYCRAYYKYISAIYSNYTTYMGPNAYPFVSLCKSTYSGTTMDYARMAGVKGHIMETTGSYTTSLTPVNLSSKWCKMTKDLLINGIMLYAYP